MDVWKPSLEGERPWLNHLTPGLTGAAGRISSRQSGQEYKGEWDIELLAVSIRPYYLPREFSHVIAITTYIPPSANADAACELLHSVVAQLQTEHPQAFLLITGDFEPRFPVCHSPQLPPGRELLNRDNKTLDLLYANTAGLQLITLPSPWAGPLRSQPGPSVPLFTCTYGEETAPQQKACEAETTVPTKRVRCFSNNKPWVTPDLRALLQEKRRAFQSGDRDELRRVQRDLETEDQRVQGQLQEENGGPPAAKQRKGGLERAPSYLRTGHWRGFVLRHLRPLVSPNMDPLQFAYQPGIGVDDAVIYLLQRSLSHLEDAGNTVRITFFDFSSAFNMIHPSLLRVKLERAGAK
ncbi:hypothetical protein L3Q82_001375 [Scortum barcoo]|uniref:Uncharacterized protein n=1 Tax=Scortum barcoo TaxID=214431 RepID=A0ACB8W813_9TELE|nr:hypothetical protein L3Q82_001375 [Scortum barcoo]